MLHKAGESVKVLLLVNCDLLLLEDDPVVLHPPLEAHAERVVPGEVGALAHQKQAVTAGCQQFLRRFPGYLAVEPGHRGCVRGRGCGTARHRLGGPGLRLNHGLLRHFTTPAFSLKNMVFYRLKTMNNRHDTDSDQILSF